MENLAMGFKYLGLNEKLKKIKEFDRAIKLLKESKIDKDIIDILIIACMKL